LAVSQRGTWNDWIVFFLRGVAEQARDAADRAQKLLVLRDEYRTKMQSAHAPGSCLLLIDSLFELPVLSVPLAATKLKMSYPGANRNVLKLVDAGILKAASQKLHPQLYMAHGILDLVSAF
jgi:Fic family protein